MSEAAVATTGGGYSKEELAVAYKAVLDGELPEGFGAAQDAEATSRAIVERIVGSDSFDDVFSPQELPAWRDVLLEKPVKVRDLRLNKSTIEGGRGSAVYAVVDVERLEDGERLQVSTGGRNVLAQLLKMIENGWQEQPVKMIAKRTAEGYDALWLVKA